MSLADGDVLVDYLMELAAELWPLRIMSESPPFFLPSCMHTRVHVQCNSYTHVL